MTTAYASDAAWNDTFWKNAKFNELLIAARSETDEAKRAAMYAEMQQILHDDGGLVNMLFNSYVEAHVKNLGHGKVAANWQLLRLLLLDSRGRQAAAEMQQKDVGNGFEDGVVQGPLIEDAAVQKVQRHVADALGKGGKLMAGGKKLQ
eukprot:gene43942-54603_t